MLAAPSFTKRQKTVQSLVDDHLHNHDFLHSSGQLWRLAPAFDVNPFPDRQRELKTWISEETGPTATIAALWSVRKYFNISLARAKAILGEVESAVGTWRDVGRKEADMSNEELAEFVAAFEHTEEQPLETTFRHKIEPKKRHSGCIICGSLSQQGLQFSQD